MEDNLQNDRLEEFLKNSFEGYSENPAGDLWDKIEENLEPVPVVPVRTFRWWWVAAAAAVVMGIFLCQHLYFFDQLDALNKKLEHNETELKKLGKDHQPTTPQAPEDAGGPPQASKKQAVDEKQAIAEQQETLLKTTPSKTFYHKKLDADLASIKPQNLTEKRDRTSPGLTETNTPMSTETPTETAIEQAALSMQNDSEGHLAGEPVWASMPDYLPSKNTRLETQGILPSLSQTVLQLLVVSTKTTGKFSIGIHVMPMATWEKIKSLRPSLPQHPDRKVFNDKTQRTGKTIYAGLTAEYKAADNFYFGSGVDYRQTILTSRHNAELRFKDRRPPGPQPGGGHHQHDFQYDLNTSAGLVEVEVRAEQADTTIDLPENEEIRLTIHTRQDLKYLSIPLHARYELGKNKLRFYFKGGLVANFLLANDFKIQEITSNNPRLRFDEGRQPKGKQQNLQPFTLDYLAGIGVDYAIMDHLKLRLEPVFSGSLTSAHNNRFIKSSQYSAGINAGLMYVF